MSPTIYKSARVRRARTSTKLLRTAGVLADGAPVARALKTHGQLSCERLIDRYGIECRPVRDLLVAYLRERQPGVDYATLHKLAYVLGRLFWRDLELHHPAIASLHLPAEVAAEWKLRITTKTKRSTDPDGAITETPAARVNAGDHLMVVRAFYLDLTEWAVDDPARWGPWVHPCPVRATEIAPRSKSRSSRKSRMDQRTRERMPVLPVLVAHVQAAASAAAERLAAAENCAPGEVFSAAGDTLRRAITRHGSVGKMWAEDPTGGKRRDLTLEEHQAFWTWAAVEVLRHTGVRIEELAELSHHSFIEYQLPDSGEVIPLLHIVPSKTDTERLLVISPELADVLSVIISRIRDDGAVPLVVAYDYHERVWNPPSPLLFQRRYGGEHRPIGGPPVRELVAAALGGSGITDASGRPLRFTPHDFRRIFVTDAILHGMPPHIAQLVVGPRDLATTMGYKAVYPEEVINSHRGFLARRRALRPSEEYRTPTDEEWEEFLGHFARRKLALGTCGRSYATPCIHEHACIRCPLLRPRPRRPPTPRRDPRQPARPHQRSPTPRLARRGRRPRGQPRRHHPQARRHRPARRPPQRHRRARPAPFLSRCRPHHHRSRIPSVKPGVLMTRGGVTDALVHDLVSRTHSEGIINLDVAAAVEHRGQALLVAFNDDELDTGFELPIAAVLPGEHLLDALCRCLAPLGLQVAQFTGYLGHRDRDHPNRFSREFCFALTATDPHAICRVPTIGHQWVDLDNPEAFPPPAHSHLIELTTSSADSADSATPRSRRTP